MEDMNVMMNETSMENEAVEPAPETVEVNPADVMDTSSETTEDANVKKALGLIITGVAVVVVAGVGIAKAVKSGHTPMKFIRNKMAKKVKEQADDAAEDYNEAVPTDSEESVEHSDDDGAEK